MQAHHTNPGNSGTFLKKSKLTLLKNFSILLIALTCFMSQQILAQGSTCSTATVLTAENSSSCASPVTFNISGTGTGPTYSSCATGRSDASNGWGQFVANGTTATITYVPASRDPMIFAYSGTCPSALTQIGCADNFGNNGTETLNLTGLTPGATYYVRIVRYNSTGSMNGTICINSLASNTITTGTISGSPFCAGASVSVPFTSTGTFTGNTYTAQLSNSAGSFASPTSIGTLVSNANSGTISATLPTTASGTGYRIRVISSSPSITGTANGTNLTINSIPQGDFSGNTVCTTGTGQLTFTASRGVEPFTIVYNNGTADRTKNNAGTGSPFTPTPPPSSTTNYTLVSVTDGNGCVRSSGFTTGTATITISSNPTITTAATATTMCTSAGAQSSNITYSATTGSPTTYSITWDATALSAGLVNVTNSAITSSPLNIPVAAGVAAGTYNGTLTVTNAAGCTSSGNAFTLTINTTPTITAAASATTKCFSSSYQNSVLTFSATTGTPITYTITWNAAGLAAGLTNVSSTALPASPIIFPVAAGSAAGTYTGTLTVANALGCSSSGNSFSFTIAPLPTITTAAATANRCASSSAQTTTLAYSATTGTPILYNITWDAAALAAGLVNVGNTSLPASPISVPIAAGVAAGTYNGTLRVLNSTGCQSSTGSSFTLTITAGGLPTMTSASTAGNCSGNTVSIPLTADLPSTFTWIAADNANTSGESTTLQSTSTLSNTISSSSAVNQNVIYTVTPTATTTGCTGLSQTVTVTVYPALSITPSASAASRCYNTGAQTTTLAYSATTGSPNQYSITWNAAAISAGLVNISNTALTSSPITFTIPAGVAAGTYTGSISVRNSTSGCSSAGSSFTLTITGLPTITSQPADRTVCSGASASFSVSASGTGLTYQWRKGTSNLCNCSNTSGVTTSTLTINPTATGDAATNYNVLVTGSGCSAVISDYAVLTVNTAASAPTSQPKDLVFPSVNITSITVSYSAAVDATNYLVVRTTTSSAPTNPSNGTTYTTGTSALGGYIEYTGTGTSFTSNGLSPGTTYYYWVFAYNTSSCGTSPQYNTTSPLSNNATTGTNVACGTITTLYWGGSGSSLSGHTTGTDFNTAANWSTSNSTYVASPVAPTQCNNVSLALNGSATITLSAAAEVYGLTFTVSGVGQTASLDVNNTILTVNGDAVIDVLSGDNSTIINIGEMGSGSGIIDFKSNFRIGETNYASNIPYSFLVGNVNSKIIFRGDVLFGRTAKVRLPVGEYPPTYPLPVPGAGTTPGTIEFDGPGLQQVLWNNNVYYDCFYNIVVGNQNTPYVKHVTGTYTPDNILNDFTINDGCTVDLGTSQWIREQSGGTFTLGAGAKLILGNNLSVRSSYSTGVRVTGSNFPGGFATLSISPTSTIEYNGGPSVTQTVYSVPTYGHLILSNTTGSGTSGKVSTGTVSISGDATISDKTTFTPGANITANGTFTINSGGRLTCGTNIVSGSGSFTLASGGTISMGSANGITQSAGSGNIQTSSRSFSTGANYIYNGTTAQATGDGLPTTMNNLTIANSSGVTLFAASGTYTVSGLTTLTSGAFDINGNTLAINSLQRTSGTLRGSSTSSITVSGTSVPLFFTSGYRTLKNLSLNTSASADLQTTLDITAGSSAGAVSVGSGATLNTYGYLTLKSDANGTARVAAIPVDGSGNALGTINGNVNIERYIPAKRSWRLLCMPVQSATAPTINAALQEGAVNTDLVYANNQNPNPGYGIHISGAGGVALGFDPTPLNNASMLKYNRSSGSWSGIANTLSTTVRDQEGFMVFVRGNRATNLSQNYNAATSNTVLRVLGNLRTGRQTVSLSGGTGSYSVVGNPFASTIDMRSVSLSGSISTNTYVLWDPALTGTSGVGAYQYFTKVGSDFTVFPGGGSYGTSGSISNYVQSGQAFLVQNSGAATVTFDESAKAVPSSSTVFRPMPVNTLGKISTLLYVVESDSSTTLLDGALMMYHNDFADSLDIDDARKLLNNSENFGITSATSLLQIERKQNITESDSIQYNMRNMKVRNYQLAIDASNIEMASMVAYLKDRYTNTVTTLNINGTTVYPFSVTADASSKAQNRFYIYFREMNVLPVSITAVNAYRKNKTINVEWNVQSESNVNRYEVEKSADGINFSQAGTVTTVMNNNSSASYQWTDVNPLNGTNFYRIKSVDNNSKGKYSSVVKVYFGKANSDITVFPNPVTDGKINVFFTEQQSGMYTARLFNNNGEQVLIEKLQQPEGSSNATINLEGKGLAHGNYVLELLKPDQTHTVINLIY